MPGFIHASVRISSLAFGSEAPTKLDLRLRLRRSGRRALAGLKVPEDLPARERNGLLYQEAIVRLIRL